MRTTGSTLESNFSERSKTASDVVALQPLAAPCQSFIDNVLQEPLAAPGLQKWAALDDTVKLLANSLMVDSLQQLSEVTVTP